MTREREVSIRDEVTVVLIHDGVIAKRGTPHPSKECFPLHLNYWDHAGETIEHQFNLTRQDAQLLRDWLSEYLAGE